MSDHNSDTHLGHVLPLSLLLKVFFALVGLTGLTVLTGQMELFGMDLAIAMVIATVKASLVCLIFMHLKWDKPFHGMIFLFSIVMVGLFLAFLTLDTGQYQADIREAKADEIHAAGLDVPQSEETHAAEERPEPEASGH
ncbi:MAG: cytochrome C oxidase subunit IV family protein [Planctomycetota bacterium]|nr:cytochrome C oxidase subunit IV family protein [Planctomycetota bacterium]MDA1113897.1 cytochrome C oxidase subunit IV family protein [Planctomycetota bacterium]